MTKITIHQGDVREVLVTLPSESVHCVVTSPPYWGLRDYGVDGQIGLEETPEEHVEIMVDVFREVKRVLRSDGTLWLNYGDSYSTETKWGDAGYRPHCPKRRRRLTKNLKPKDLIGMPWKLAFALRDDGWWLRSDIVFHKANPLPEPVRDRPAKAHEYVFLLAKTPRYFYDADAVREPAVAGDRPRRDSSNPPHTPPGTSPHRGIRKARGHPKEDGRNLRTVWTIPTQPTPEAHFATFPEKLVVPCVKAGTSERGCCPDCGAPLKRQVAVNGAALGQAWLDHENDRVEGQARAKLSRDYHRETTGWEKTCDCDATDPVPCTVLDPFFGSGTTGIVAMKLGRDAIGIELNREYVEIARRRIGDDLFCEVEVLTSERETNRCSGSGS